MDIETLNLARKYADKVLKGQGAIQGEDGKSAYQSAVDGGYTGTEEEFEELLATIPTTDDVTLQKDSEGVISVDSTRVTGVYNVLDYGLVADGDTQTPTDNTVALRSMIAKVPDGATIYFPSGVYRITGNINLTKNLSFIGETKHKQYIATSNYPQDSVIDFHGTIANTTVFTRDAYKTASFQNLTFKGNSFVVAPNSESFSTLPYPYHVESTIVSGVNCLELNGVNAGSSYVKDCIFVGFSGFAVSLKQHKYVDNCGFSCCGIAIRTVFESMVSDCWFNLCANCIELVPDGDKLNTYIQVKGCWADRISQHFIFGERVNQVHLEIESVIVDMVDECAFYFPNAFIYQSVVVGKFSRIGMKYAGLADADRTEEKAAESDFMFCKQIKNCTFILNTQETKCVVGANSNAECISRWFYTTTQGAGGSGNTIIHPLISVDKLSGNSESPLYSTKLIGQGGIFYINGGATNNLTSNPTNINFGSEVVF